MKPATACRIREFIKQESLYYMKKQSTEKGNDKNYHFEVHQSMERLVRNNPRNAEWCPEHSSASVVVNPILNQVERQLQPTMNQVNLTYGCEEKSEERRNSTHGALMQRKLNNTIRIMSLVIGIICKLVQA